MTAKVKHAVELNEMQEPLEAVGDGLREMVRTMVQELMEEAVSQHRGASRHERTETRQGYRNGHRTRKWKTRVGELGAIVEREGLKALRR